MFLIRPSHCLHVVTVSPSAHPSRPTQVPSDCGVLVKGCRVFHSAADVTGERAASSLCQLIYCNHLAAPAVHMGELLVKASMFYSHFCYICHFLMHIITGTCAAAAAGRSGLFPIVENIVE